MPGTHARPSSTQTGPTAVNLPHRRTIAWSSGVLAAAGLIGTWQLVSGTATPPVSDLAPLGLTSWTLPGLWLFGTVVVPWSVAVFASVGRRPSTPLVVLVACGSVVFELVVQIPFIGPSPLQVVLGAAAGGLAWCAVDARRRGWRSQP
ncbi:MAG: hypothetical protein ABWZ99_18910 [Ilumatobacteraceae bacterium]